MASVKTVTMARAQNKRGGGREHASQGGGVEKEGEGGEDVTEEEEDGSPPCSTVNKVYLVVVDMMPERIFFMRLRMET